MSDSASPPSSDNHNTATTIAMTSTEPAHPSDGFNEYYVLLWYNKV
jgi:hypothetical protein